MELTSTAEDAAMGKLGAGNRHVWLDDDEVAPAVTPSRGSLLCKKPMRRHLYWHSKDWCFDIAKLAGVLLMALGQVEGAEICEKVSIEAVRSNDAGSSVVKGPGIGLSFSCRMKEATSGASWTSYEGPFTVYRDGVCVATVETASYRDADVPVGESHTYRVAAHGESSDSTRFTCDVNYVVTTPESDTTVEFASQGGSVSFAVSVVKSVRRSYMENGNIQYRITSESWPSAGWATSSDADWCVVAKAAANVTLSAEQNLTGARRQAIVTILVDDCIRRRIAVTQAGTVADAVTVATGEGYDISVPFDWFNRYAGFNERYGNNLKEALLMKNGKCDAQGNDLHVWQDYVMGTDPTEVNSMFRARIEMENGAPVIKWDPDLNTNGAVRIYTVYGRERLDGGYWEHPVNSRHKFFKVSVGMP